ncbi:imelysin family protein [Roseobacter sp. YSTF-M11]|uniref:Imelysin family protein n=1 Tax=Roseobacter insulae TaxID=2859783 RepID=A0A9X1K4Q3_9RHOB|nr:imelysin family protein [Roseobacter insulae]
MRLIALCCGLLGGGPAVADLMAVRDQHILPGYAAFAAASKALEKTARDDCSPRSVLPVFHVAFDAWVSISHVQFGPVETRGASLSLAFWPDPKDRVGKALARLSHDQDAAVQTPDAFAQVSVAVQGFTALERLLTEPQGDPAYACRLTHAITRNIRRIADALTRDWNSAFGTAFVTAGAASNPTFPDSKDAERAVFTSLSTALEFLHDQRLGRPLGTFERPRPKRAEARRSDRSARHVILSLTVLKDLTNVFAHTPLGQVNAAFDAALARVAALDDPAFAGVSDPVRRLRIEALQHKVRELQIVVARDVGVALGINTGFNSLDGD